EPVVSAHHVLARAARRHLRHFVNHEDRKAMTTCHPGALRASRPNRGQALVLLSLFLIVLLAGLGLGVDGGNLYLQRRGAQLAADASALAGARLMGTPTRTGPATRAEIEQHASAHHVDNPAQNVSADYTHDRGPR